MPRVVVGVDGSDHARRAVRHAVEEAKRRGAALDVVTAVTEPAMFMDPVMVPPPPRDELRAAGLEVIDQSLAGVDTGSLTVERISVVGGTSKVLCEAAEGADLLVVGSRGLGGFRGLLVGSITQQVVAHSPCPVLVVVPENRRAVAHAALDEHEAG